MLKFNSGKVWPYAIGLSIIAFFGAIVLSISVAMTMPVEKSDTYMMDYHHADNNANEIIMARIAFDAKYKIAYITEGLSEDNSILKYKVTDLEDNPVNNAKIKVVITRPNNHDHDQELLNPQVNNGTYTFDSVTLALPGRWDVMAKVNVDDLQRFYNVKADTRAKEAFEY